MEKFKIADDIPVLYVKATSFPAGIQSAFKELENKLSGTGDRAYYGISRMGPGNQIIYLAGASPLHEEEGEQLELETFIVRKGTYLSVLIKDFMNDIPAIGQTFQRLLKHPALDTDSYCLELYQGNDVLCMIKLDLEKLTDISSREKREN